MVNGVKSRTRRDQHMDNQICDFSRAKRVALCMIAFALVSLGGSLFWERLHLACVVTAILAGALASFFLSLHWQYGDRGKFNLLGMVTAVLPMIILTDHFHGYGVFFQYLGVFHLAWSPCFLFFKSRVPKRNESSISERNIDPPL